MFKAFGHIAFKEREEPWLDTLAAFSGYNGTLLWKRPIPAALMVHRNTLIATPTTLYFGDDQSCKVIDAATGQTRDEIAPPADVAGGTFWKWMALEDGVLYAMIGEQEERDPVIRLRSTGHGWPWDPLSPGYNRPEHTWGFGRTLLAIDPQTKQVLWHYEEPEPIDSRALCMSHGRIYAFRSNAYLTCLDAKTGTAVWRKTPQNDGALFETLGMYLKRQDWRTNWRTTAYLKCSDQALYFAGPQVGKLVAVSAADGHVLWEQPHSNYQLVLRDDGLYALSGQVGAEVGMERQFRMDLANTAVASRKFEPLTGEVLAEFPLGRRACTRPTGAIDAVFCRASGGSTRLDAASKEWALISPMRAQCQDGVTIANGLLYWWPSTCDCNLTLYGITCLGPAGDFRFDEPANDADRLESSDDERQCGSVAAVGCGLADLSRKQQQYCDDGGRSARLRAAALADQAADRRDAHGSHRGWHARVCRGLGWRCARAWIRPPASRNGRPSRAAPCDYPRPLPTARTGRLGRRLGLRVGGRDRPATLAVPRRADRTSHSGLRPADVDVAGGQRRVGRRCRGVCGGGDREL